MSKIVFLTKDSPRSRVLAHRIAREFNLAAIVLEAPAENKKQPKSLKGRIKNLVVSLLGKKLFSYLREPKEQRLMRKIEKTLREKSDQHVLSSFDIPTGWPVGAEVMRTTSVNNSEVVKRLEEISPDLIVVYGTSILREPVISTAALGVLNAHTSVLPEYRGAFVEFWQAYHCDYEHCGFTIHFVDTGVDTGDIVYQEKLSEVNDKTDPYHIRALNTVGIVNAYPKVIRMVLEGKLGRKPQGKGTHPTFRFRDMTPDKKRELYRRLGYLD